tara:strand:+ start:1669 stop:2370 length:702 start_codon:yes stop_codon:yes gene_type:complete
MKQCTIIYKNLLNTFGPQGWWPVTPPGHVEPVCDKGPRTTKQKLEVCFGAILTQNTSWKNVEKAIMNLNKENLVDLRKIKNISNAKLAAIIRPSGYFNQKAIKLKAFCNYVLKKYDGNLDTFFSRTPKGLRAELLSIHGIGPETADSIILYAAEKPSFVIDAYTKRIFSRFGLCRKEIDYHQLKEAVEKNVKKNTKMYNEYHALLVELAKKHCLSKYPVCSSCPLTEDCGKEY